MWQEVPALWLVSTARWKPQEEGMMSTAASFSSVVKPRFLEPVGESQTLEVMLASFVTLQTLAPGILLVCLHLAAT
jgi:hypothetical protein